MKITMRPARALPKIIIHRKVAAYCRVSTQQEIQHHSLEAQLCCVSTGGQNKEVSGRDSFASAPLGEQIEVRLRRAVGGKRMSTGHSHLIVRVPSARSAK